MKESPEKRKLRLVVDMRRSSANARAAVPERPILPRPRDVVADWEELFSEAASLGFTSEAGVSCENVTCDFSGACCLVLVHTRRTQELFGRGSAFPFWIRSKRCARVVWVWVRKVHHSRGAESRLLLEGLRKHCWWAPVGRAMQQAESTNFGRPTPQLACDTNAARQSIFEPCYSFGPQQDSKSLGPKGRGPEWPNGSDWSSHQIFQAIRSLSESQPKLQIRSSKMRKNC